MMYPMSSTTTNNNLRRLFYELIPAQCARLLLVTSQAHIFLDQVFSTIDFSRNVCPYTQWAELGPSEKWGRNLFLNECYFSGKSLKMSPDALISAQNAPKCVLRPSSEQTPDGVGHSASRPQWIIWVQLLRGREGNAPNLVCIFGG